MTSTTTSSVVDPLVGSHPHDVYRDAFARYGDEATELERTMRRVETARMAIFVVGAVAALLRNELPLPVAVTTTAAAVALVAFVVLVFRHRRLKRKVRRLRIAHALAGIGVLRLERDWEALHSAYEELGYQDRLLTPRTAADHAHPYVYDLDVFGPASVRALLGPTPTPTGVATLERWLSEPAPPDEVRRRQSAVRSLAGDYEGRERLAIEALLLDRMDREQWTQLIGWLSMRPVFASASEPPDAGQLEALPSWLVHVARVLPIVTLGTFAGWSVGFGFPSATWAIPLAVQGGLAWWWGQTLRPFLDRASAASGGLRGHHALFSAWESFETHDAEIGRLQFRLGGETGVSASEEIRALERWLDAAESRASMFHFVFAWVTLWDVHVAWGLERWRGRAGSHVADWFEALGELEALSALATLAFDHPTWCWPEIHDGEPGLEGDALGHPLLRDRVLKTSDVRIDAPGRFLLVTGSNMSGKSTLLRSIGLASVLAQAGSVVCASRARLTPLRTFTSMRIQDSLTEGVSLFMAELLRLKALVDAADAGEGAPALLYLIDEVLQGTNSEERRIAARRIVRHLLTSNAVGAVTTHDLALHDDADLDPASVKVHFREQVHEDGARVLSFDYVLRPGLATSRNALKLLRIVGLDEVEGTPATEDGSTT